jgi:putative ABC transport system permease protein
MSITLIWSTLILGLLYGLLVLGVFLTFRILNYADLSVDGSLPLGAAITATLIFNGMNPFLATLLAIPLGALAGLITGILHTRFSITPLLSGILTMIGLYSINLRIMSRPNVTLLRHDTIFDLLASATGLSLRLSQSVVALAVIVAAVVGLYLFLNTELGQALRGTGDNEVMLRSLGVNTDRMKILGLAISNALVALSGAMIAQYQGFADINVFPNEGFKRIERLAYIYLMLLISSMGFTSDNSSVLTSRGINLRSSASFGTSNAKGIIAENEAPISS